MIFLSGCSQREITNSIDNTMSRMAGNKPTTSGSLIFPDAQTANSYMFSNKDFQIVMPKTYSKDWKRMGGWYGSSRESGFIVRVRQTPRGIDGNSNWVSYRFQSNSESGRYREIDKAIEDKDVGYLKSNLRTAYPMEKLYMRNCGKENYPCMVTVSRNKSGIKKMIGYTCYKYNPSRTMVKQVHTKFTYVSVPSTSSEVQNLKQIYTCDDLLQRGKRALDSLYIKDGW